MNKILIIDDIRDNLIALKALLINLRPDFEIQLAESGREGIQSTSEFHPDVIILDISMPEMDGYEVCRILKSDKRTQTIPIILMTAYNTDTHSRIRGLEEGADAFLMKPVDSSELLAQIKAMLRIKAAEDKLRMQTTNLEDKVAEQGREAVISRRQYQLLYDFAPDIYCNIDELNYIININDFGARYLGYEKYQLIGKHFSELFHPEDRDRDGVLFRDAEKPGEARRLMKRNKSFIRVSSRSQRVPDLNSGGVGTLIILRDVSESFNYAEQLKRQEREFRTLYENLPIGVFRTDAKGLILLANPALVTLLGFTSFDQLRSTNDLRLQLGYEHERFMSTLIKHGRVTGLEFQLQKKNGGECYVRENAIAVANQEGEILYYEGTLEDISRFRQSEIALSDSEARIRLIAEQATDAMIGFNMDGRIEFWNTAAEQMFLCTKSDLISRDCFEFLPFLTKDELTRIFPQQSKLRQQLREEIAQRTDGSVFQIELSFSRLDQHPTPFVFAVIRDVSERKRLEQEREEALHEAQQGERVKSLFIANMSHEIRTPLNAILGFSMLLEEELKDMITDDQLEYFASIRNSGSRLTSTIHSILILSQLEAGVVSMQPRAHDVALLLHQIADDFLPPAKEKGLELSTDFSVERAQCFIDANSVVGALSNIIDNAIKYTVSGSVVIVLEADTNSYWVRIKDSGMGIPDHFLPRLFEPFSQGSEGYTKVFQGIGLGLALAKRYIELNNGAIEVSSEPGIGTTISVRLPAA
jgi:PAS domain S-box-containing protein